MASTTVYSKSPEAGRKRVIDLEIMGFNFIRIAAVAVDIENEDYLKQLIDRASNGMVKVSDHTDKLQFFIIKGGAEGFLNSSHDGVDASRMVEGRKRDTDGKPGTEMTLDDTCLLAVFNRLGGLIGSALLIRPIIVITPDDPTKWTEPTANAVFDAWDKSPVSLYHNRNFEVEYFGLWMDDTAGFYRGRHQGRVRQARIDIHKDEATDGCILIIQDGTPPLPDNLGPHPTAAQVALHQAALDKLNHFEPKLIQDIQAVIKAKTRENIGMMRVIKIK
jgi:hypothetical protein